MTKKKSNWKKAEGVLRKTGSGLLKIGAGAGKALQKIDDAASKNQKQGKDILGFGADPLGRYPQRRQSYPERRSDRMDMYFDENPFSPFPARNQARKKKKKRKSSNSSYGKGKVIIIRT